MPSRTSPSSRTVMAGGHLLARSYAASRCRGSRVAQRRSRSCRVGVAKRWGSYNPNLLFTSFSIFLHLVALLGVRFGDHLVQLCVQRSCCLSRGFSKIGPIIFLSALFVVLSARHVLSCLMNQAETKGSAMQCHNIASCTSKVSSLLFTSVYICNMDQEVTKTFFQFSRLIFIRGLQATGLSSLIK